jgi:hypothetical protein
MQSMLAGWYYRITRLCLGGIGLWLFATVATATPPAFPGAEGFGAFALGGRSGTVYHVTNLGDSGSGSFRDAVSAANRTIVFDVSGTINLGSNLSITKSNLTIAGQTAPGDGITLKGWLTSVQNTRNVIVRFIRCRPGDVNCPTFQDDAFHFVSCSNVIADHISASWSIDEALSTTWSSNATVQWCMITEPLNTNCHLKGPHGYGSLIRYGGGGITYHHNLYADCDARNPRGPSDKMSLDFVNNVVYNWGHLAGYDEDGIDDNPGGYVCYGNYVGNYLIAGPNTAQNPPFVFRAGVTNSAGAACVQIYQSGNLMDTNRNGVLDGDDRGWARFGGPFTTNTTRLAFPQVTTDTATVAYARVLSSVGASVVRDAVDSRVISNVISQTGVIIDSQNSVGGWPTLNSLPAPLDSDQDGMPDFWELAVGLSTNNAADRNDLAPSGYTRLEEYLNWLAGPHARAQMNTSVNVDLRQYTAGLQGPTYTVSSASNGVIALLGDGHTAQFTPSTGFFGLGSFQFSAANAFAGFTSTVSVVVTPSVTPPLTAFQQWQILYFSSTNNPAADPSADPDGDGMSNTNEFLAGTNPTNNQSALRILSAVRQTTDVVITWTTAGGFTNAVQATSGDGKGGYTTNNFMDISGLIAIQGSGDVTATYVDGGGATNRPSRYYRVRLVP